MFTSLNNPDEDKVRQQIGVYYSHIPKPSTDETVVFSVPYNDTGGLGTDNLQTVIIIVIIIITQ